MLTHARANARRFFLAAAGFDQRRGGSPERVVRALKRRWWFPARARGRRALGSVSTAVLRVVLGVALGSIYSAARAADVTINVNTLAVSAIPRGFSGFNAPQPRNAVEYFDPNFVNAAASLRPGWVRFPGGTADDAYDWTTGHLNQDWVNVFSVTNVYNLLANALKLTQAKGGVFFSDFSAFVRTLGAAGIVCINGFTDTNPGTAKNMALAAQSNNLIVAAWELANEPYLFVPILFSSATAFADAMRVYFDDIISVNPAAAVAMPFAGQFTGFPPSTFTAYDAELSAYSPRYWNAVATHIYPITDSTMSPANAEAFLNGILAHGSTDYINSYLLPLVGKRTPVYITEFNSTADASVVFQTYLYNGIFLVEYVLRMSAHPNIKRIGVHALYMGQSYQSGMIQAAGKDYEGYLMNVIYPNSVNTSGWGFDFFRTAPALTLEIANQAINSSTSLYATSVSGGVKVPISGYDGQPIPAIYAQAYQGATGKHYLVVTNKAGISQTAAVLLNGSPLVAPLSLIYMSSADPTVANTADNPQAVQVQNMTATSPITLPPYSVMRVEW